MYHVRWTDRADSELADVWLSSESRMRPAINSAVAEMRRRLQKDPLSEGESREQGKRVSFEYPLGFSFRVESETLVVVGHVWSIVRGAS
jgi:hypothetical protein